MGILLFPILQFFLLFLTGRKKVKDFMFRFCSDSRIAFSMGLGGRWCFVYFLEILDYRKSIFGIDRIRKEE